MDLPVHTIIWSQPNVDLGPRPRVFMSQRDDVDLLDVGVVLVGRGVAGGERGPRYVSRITPPSASIAMQPAPEQATPSGARKPKRSPSPLDDSKL